MASKISGKMAEISMGKALWLLEHKIKNNLLTPTMFLGASGIGKTAMLSGLAEKLGYELVDLRLAEYSAVDLKGVPDIDRETKTTQWFKDEILPRDNANEDRKVLLVLDEITSIEDRNVQTVVYQLLNERRLGLDYCLPKNCHIVGLGNRPQDGGNYASLLAPLRNRMSIYEINFDFEIWSSWAAKTGLNVNVLSFLTQNKDRIFSYDDDSEGTEENMVFATVRSWTNAAYMLDTLDITDEDSLYIALTGMIPAPITSEFLTHLTIVANLPSVEDIATGKKSYDDVKESYKDSAGFILAQPLGKFCFDKFKNAEEKEFIAVMKNTVNFLLEYDVMPATMFIKYLQQAGTTQEFAKVATIMAKNEDLKKITRAIDSFK